MLDKILYNTVLSQTLSPCGKYLLAGNIYGQIAVFELKMSSSRPSGSRYVTDVELARYLNDDGVISDSDGEPDGSKTLEVETIWRSKIQNKLMKTTNHWSLNRILNPIAELFTTDYNKPKHIHTLESGNQVCSLVSAENFLIVGSVNEIAGWEWKNVLCAKLSKPSWCIKISSQTPLEKVDVNSMWLSDDEAKLYAGCGDNNIYVYNLDGGRLLSTLKGHTDFIHSVHGKNQQLISASEDGTVLLWDTRSRTSQNKLEPHTNSKVSRPDIGKWVGSASLCDDWIVCGGGPRLSLWHLRSLDVVTVFDIPDHGIHVSYFHDDCVIAGGTAKHLYQLCYSGDVKVELPVSATTVYSVVLRTTPNKILAIAGSSPEIDLCTSFNYRDQVLHFR